MRDTDEVLNYVKKKVVCRERRKKAIHAVPLILAVLIVLAVGGVVFVIRSFTNVQKPAVKTDTPVSCPPEEGRSSDSRKITPKVEYDNPVLEELAQCSPYELYERSLAVATEEQRKQLKAIHDNRYFGEWEEAYTREIKTIMGLIPAEAPYITLEQAKAVIREMKEEGILAEDGSGDPFDDHIYLVRDRFNEIAYAPDTDGGSGFTIIRYSVDAERTGFIELHSCLGIQYYNVADDTWTVLYQPYGE